MLRTYPQKIDAYIQIFTSAINNATPEVIKQEILATALAKYSQYLNETAEKINNDSIAQRGLIHPQHLDDFKADPLFNLLQLAISKQQDQLAKTILNFFAEIAAVFNQLLPLQLITMKTAIQTNNQEIFSYILAKILPLLKLEHNTQFSSLLYDGDETYLKNLYKNCYINQLWQALEEKNLLRLFLNIDKNTGKNLLHYLARYNNFNVAQSLLVYINKMNASFWCNLPDNEGLTPLNYLLKLRSNNHTQALINLFLTMGAYADYCSDVRNFMNVKAGIQLITLNNQPLQSEVEVWLLIAQCGQQISLLKNLLTELNDLPTTSNILLYLPLINYFTLLKILTSGIITQRNELVKQTQLEINTLVQKISCALTKISSQPFSLNLPAAFEELVKIFPQFTANSDNVWQFRQTCLSINSENSLIKIAIKNLHEHADEAIKQLQQADENMLGFTKASTAI